MSSAEATRKHRARMKALGLKRVSVWVTPEKAERIKAEAKAAVQRAELEAWEAQQEPVEIDAKQEAEVAQALRKFEKRRTKKTRAVAEITGRDGAPGVAGQDVGDGRSTMGVCEDRASHEGSAATEVQAKSPQLPEKVPERESVLDPAQPVAYINSHGKDQQPDIEELLRRELPLHMAISR